MHAKQMARFAGLFVAAGLCANAVAGSFVVTPVRVELSDSRRSAELTVSNDDDAPLTLQLRAVAWLQVDERDTLTDTAELLATPTVFELAPRETRKIRVALRHPGKSSVEVAYRLFIQEVPQVTSSAVGIQVALRMSVPVFVAPEVIFNKPLQWRATERDGQTVLSVVNAANHGTRLLNLQVTSSAGVPGDALAMAYVLAGQRHSWTLPQSTARGAAPILHVTVLTDDGGLSVDVPVDAP